MKRILKFKEMLDMLDITLNEKELYTELLLEVQSNMRIMELAHEQAENSKHAENRQDSSQKFYRLNELVDKQLKLLSILEKGG